MEKHGPLARPTWVWILALWLWTSQSKMGQSDILCHVRIWSTLLRPWYRVGTWQMAGFCLFFLRPIILGLTSKLQWFSFSNRFYNLILLLYFFNKFLMQISMKKWNSVSKGLWGVYTQLVCPVYIFLLQNVLYYVSAGVSPVLLAYVRKNIF